MRRTTALPVAEGMRRAVRGMALEGVERNDGAGAVVLAGLGR